LCPDKVARLVAAITPHILLGDAARRAQETPHRPAMATAALNHQIEIEFEMDVRAETLARQGKQLRWRRIVGPVPWQFNQARRIDPRVRLAFRVKPPAEDADIRVRAVENELLADEVS